VATTVSEGAQAEWPPEVEPYFKSRDVIVIPDNDPPGAKHARKVARGLSGVAASIRILDLAPHWPGETMPKGHDVFDWITGHDRAGSRLAQLAKEAPLWEPGAAEAAAGGAAADEEIIADLATLGPLAYAKRRKAASAAIGVGVGELDRIVAKARGDASAEAGPKTHERWQIEPWEEPVATADLLNDLREKYAAHVILPEHGAEAMALWVLHAWSFDASYISPFLRFTSPEPRCGKSRALTLLYKTGPRTALSSNISAAAIFRYIESHSPTLLIDEADSFARDDEALRGVLNSGHSRDTAFVVRCEGDANEPKEFSTWAPKAIAGIGELAPTPSYAAA
jgi:hypothetical protein